MKGLSLSGGGVLGAAQAGMLYRAFETDKEFIRYKYPADYWQYISGTSIGALNGLLIAMKYTAREIYEIWYNIKKSDLLSYNFNVFESIYKRHKMKKFIENLIIKKFGTSEVKFDDIELICGVDLNCFATVVQTGKALVFGKDFINCNVVDAIMMTTAYPVAFPPIEISSKKTNEKFQVIDGGILNNSPILPLIKSGCDDITILSIGNLNKNFSLSGPMSTLKRVLEFVTIGNEFVSLSWASHIMKDKIKVYRCECEDVGPFDWNKIHVILEKGIKSWENGPVDPNEIITQYSTSTIDEEGIEENIIKGNI